MYAINLFYLFFTYFNGGATDDDIEFKKKEHTHKFGLTCDGWIWLALIFGRLGMRPRGG